MDSQLVLERDQLDKIARYEAMLEREFERKQEHLLNWRNRKREAYRP